MAIDARTLLLSWLLPGIAGLGAGVVLMAPKEKAAMPKSSEVSADRSETAKLPDDPTVIQLAALAGRTGEARKKIEALFAENAPDEAIAEWLAPVLIADPAWLESFILTVHEPRRIDLVRATIWKISEISPDAAWELVRSSPFAAMAARTTGSDVEREGLDVLNGCHDSPLAAEVLFDPANGFSTEEATKFFRFGSQNTANNKRLLKEWFAGRWEGEAPECVRAAWLNLRWLEESTLRELEKEMPEALETQAERFESLGKLTATAGMITEDPSAEELGILGPEELAQFAESRTEAGRPLPLETLAELPPELRGQTFDTYFSYLYPYHQDVAQHALDVLDQLGLKRSERQALLEGAVAQEWSFTGDHEKALEIIARMPDREAAEERKGEVLEDLVKFDPQTGLEFIKTMPSGELKERMEKLAAEGMP
jgi:hypothetical protein